MSTLVPRLGKLRRAEVHNTREGKVLTFFTWTSHMFPEDRCTEGMTVVTLSILLGL